MSIEDRVRAATRARADLVRAVRPLELPDEVPARARRIQPARRWNGWLTPLAAAAAAAAVVATLVVVRGLDLLPSASRSATVTAPATVPRYYAVVDRPSTGYPGTGDVIVGDDRTGQVIATVSPPHGLQFDKLEGGSDDRTFVVMASSQATSGTAPDTWYLLRIAPGTAHPYQLTKLSIQLPATSASDIAYALSPDNRELAVESQSSASSSVTTLGVYSVSSGRPLRAWTTSKNITSGPADVSLSWLPDGRQLAFSAWSQTTNPAGSLQLRTVDTAGSGTDLMAASRALLTVTLSGPSTCAALSVTPDGGTVVCGTQYNFLSGSGGSDAGCANGGLEFTAYSVRTGQPVGVLYQYRGACSNGLSYVLWTDASAGEIIGTTVINPTSGGKPSGQVGVIANGHISLFKIPPSVSLTDYPDMAF
jgi:hypothetical protein